MVVLADPVNPTGAVFHPDDREYIAWLAAAHDALVYVDQAFAELHPAGPQVRWEQIAGITSRLLVAGSLSWSHNLSGWRVGWLIAPSLLVRAGLALQQLHAALVPTPCQALAAAGLRQTDSREQLATFRRWQHQRQQALDLFQRWGLESGDSGQGGFLWVSTASLRLSGQVCAEVLAQQYRLRVLAGEVCGPSGQNMIRLCLLHQPGQWQEALRRLSQFVTDWTRTAASAPPGGVTPSSLASAQLHCQRPPKREPNRACTSAEARTISDMLG
jgi:aminotransferase